MMPRPIAPGKKLNVHAIDDQRIQLHQNTSNLGYNQNFSQACARVATPLLAFADQDDLWHEEKIERLVKALGKNSPLIYCNSRSFTGDTPQTTPPKSLYQRFEGSNILQLSLFNTVNGHAILARTDFIKKILPFPAHLFYDWYIAGKAASRVVFNICRNCWFTNVCIRLTHRFLEKGLDKKDKAFTYDSGKSTL